MDKTTKKLFNALTTTSVIFKQFSGNNSIAGLLIYATYGLWNSTERPSNKQNREAIEHDDEVTKSSGIEPETQLQYVTEVSKLILM